MVADDVEVAVVDERLVAGVEDELDVVHLRLHEHVDHGEVHVARVGERHLTNMESFPRNINKIGKNSSTPKKFSSNLVDARLQKSS